MDEDQADMIRVLLVGVRFSGNHTPIPPFLLFCLHGETDNARKLFNQFKPSFLLYGI